MLLAAPLSPSLCLAGALRGSRVHKKTGSIFLDCAIRTLSCLCRLPSDGGQLDEREWRCRESEGVASARSVTRRRTVQGHAWPLLEATGWQAEGSKAASFQPSTLNVSLRLLGWLCITATPCLNTTRKHNAYTDSTYSSVARSPFMLSKHRSRDTWMMCRTQSRRVDSLKRASSL